MGHDCDNGGAKGGLGLGFEECDMQVAIWVLVVINLRFWVVTVDAAWLRCHRGCGGSSMLLVVAPFLWSNLDP